MGVIVPVLKKLIKPRKWRLSGLNVVCLAVACGGIACGAIGLFLGSNPDCKQTSPMRPTASRPLFMLLGDSLTQYGADSNGWSTLLQGNYRRSADVLNRGLSGFNTAGFINNALPVISKELQTSYAPSLITIWFGANDAALANGRSSGQHVPLDAYRANLISILHHLHQLVPNATLLLITPPVVDDATRRRIQVNEGGPSDPLDRTNEQAGKYAVVCAEVAAAVEGVVLLDLYGFLMYTYPNATDRAALLGDGLHFSEIGNKIVFEQVKNASETLLSAERLYKVQIQ